MMLTALGSVAAAAVVGAGLVRQATEAAALAELRNRAADISSRPRLLRPGPARERPELRESLGLVKRALKLSGASVYRIAPDGSLELAGGDQTVTLADDQVAELASGTPVEGSARKGSEEVIFVAQPVAGSGGLVLLLAREAESTPVQPLAGRMLAAAAIAAAAAVPVSLYFSGRITRPLRELADAASEVARGNFDRRVHQKTPGREVEQVADSFNRMAAELGYANRQQRDFFLSISHELRTPLTAIQGYAEAIEDGTASGESIKDAASVIVTEARRLTGLVSDLLDLARIDASRFEVVLQKVDLQSVLADVEQTFGPKAKDGNIDLLAKSGQIYVEADRDRLIQVLANLVENALRYTPSFGVIEINARQLDSMARIDVIDSGPGFDPGDLSRAFERQYLWRKYRGIRDVGTGLGLAITKELVEAMSGRVTASLGPQGGALFSVELPLAARN